MIDVSLRIRFLVSLTDLSYQCDKVHEIDVSLGI